MLNEIQMKNIKKIMLFFSSLNFLDNITDNILLFISDSLFKKMKIFLFIYIHVFFFSFLKVIFI